MPGKFEQVYGEAFYLPCRVTYVNLAKPDTGSQYSRGKYCVTALVPKTDEAAMQEALNRLAFVTGVSDFNQIPKHPFLNQKGEWRDGDTAAHDGAAGCWFFTTSTDSQPPTYTVINTENGEPVECDPREIYNGCYCALLLTPAWIAERETATLYLNGVIMMDHGSRLSAGRTDPVQAFRNWSGGGNVQPAAAAKPMPPLQTAAAPAQQAAPAQEAAPAAEQAPPAQETAQPQQRRTRRTKAEMEASRAATGPGAPPTSTGQAVTAATSGPQFGAKPGAVAGGAGQSAPAAAKSAGPSFGNGSATTGAAPRNAPAGRSSMSDLLVKE